MNCTAEGEKKQIKFLGNGCNCTAEQRHQSLSIPAGRIEGNRNQGGSGWEVLGDPESSTAHSLWGELSETQLPAAVKEFSVAAGLPPMSLLLMGTNMGLGIPGVVKAGLVLNSDCNSPGCHSLSNVCGVRRWISPSINWAAQSRRDLGKCKSWKCNIRFS